MSDAAIEHEVIRRWQEGTPLRRIAEELRISRYRVKRIILDHHDRRAQGVRHPELPVLPGVNTSFMGMTKETGVWDERCAACGECRLEDTAGICPITRCTKAILNGPCAGTKNGKCEANKDMDCAWVLIYQRLERLQQLEKIRRYFPPRNYRTIPRPRRIMSITSIDTGEGDG